MSPASILIVITVVSVVLAAGTSIALLRRVRQERVRSEARVALLRDLAAEADDLVLRPDNPVNQRSGIFHVDTDRTPWVGRFVAASAVAVLVVGGAWTWSALPSKATGASNPSSASSSSSSSTARVDAALELLSLRHTQEDQSFVVAGLVQNPRTGRQLVRIEATVLLFDNRGTMLTSGRAPIDFTTLAAGDESPFLIRVPVSAAVARYRVGFRRADGQVLGHVDRRNHESVAQREEP